MRTNEQLNIDFNPNLNFMPDFMQWKSHPYLRCLGQLDKVAQQ